MELKPGYKQTEVGVIPEDWEVKTLQEGSKLLSGHHVLAKHCNIEGIGFPYITGPADFPEGVIRHSKFTDKPTTICQPNDILVTVKGSGAGTLILANGEYCISRQLMAIRVPTWDTAFIYSALLQDESLFGAAATGLIPGLSRGDILNKQIAIPPILEQRLIAEALNDADELIRALDQLITKKRDIKQAAMQHLLTGRKRLPGFDCSGGQFRQSDVGLIPDDWQVKPLGSILTKARLGGNYPNQSLETGYPLMKMGNLARGQFDVSKVEYISAGITPNPTDRLRRGDILFNTRNTLDLVGKVAIWRDELPEAYYNSNLMRLEFDPREICSNEYANYAFNSASEISRLRALATGTTSVAAIYTRDLLQLPFIVPSLHEQCAIASVLSDIDDEVTALEQRREKTRALRQGMMQELLTGKTRLVDSSRPALIPA